MLKSIVATLAFCGLLALPSIALAWDGWKEALASGGSRSPLAESYSWSILFMMAAPFLTVGVVTGIVVRAYRREAKPIPLEPDDPYFNLN